MNLYAPQRLRARARLASAAAAVGVTLFLGAGLLGAFHAASPPQWLPASPEVLAELAHCDARPDRAAREHCRQQTARRRLEPADAAIRIAAGQASRAAARQPRP